MKNEIDINELREMLSNFLTLDQTERDALLMNLLNWLLERVAALEAAQAETANMRNVITLQQGAIEDLLASVAMLNDEIASRPVAALEAARPAPETHEIDLSQLPAVTIRQEAFSKAYELLNEAKHAAFINGNRPIEKMIVEAGELLAYNILTEGEQAQQWKAQKRAPKLLWEGRATWVWTGPREVAFLVPMPDPPFPLETWFTVRVYERKEEAQS